MRPNYHCMAHVANHFLLFLLFWAPCTSGWRDLFGGRSSWSPICWLVNSWIIAANISFSRCVFKPHSSKFQSFNIKVFDCGIDIGSFPIRGVFNESNSIVQRDALAKLKPYITCIEIEAEDYKMPDTFVSVPSSVGVVRLYPLIGLTSSKWMDDTWVISIHSCWHSML